MVKEGLSAAMFAVTTREQRKVRETRYVPEKLTDNRHFVVSSVFTCIGCVFICACVERILAKFTKFVTDFWEDFC